MHSQLTRCTATAISYWKSCCCWKCACAAAFWKECERPNRLLENVGFWSGSLTANTLWHIFASLDVSLLETLRLKATLSPAGDSTQRKPWQDSHHGCIHQGCIPGAGEHGCMLSCLAWDSHSCERQVVCLWILLHEHVRALLCAELMQVHHVVCVVTHPSQEHGGHNILMCSANRCAGSADAMEAVQLESGLML